MFAAGENEQVRFTEAGALTAEHLSAAQQGGRLALIAHRRPDPTTQRLATGLQMTAFGPRARIIECPKLAGTASSRWHLEAVLQYLWERPPCVWQQFAP